ncbi:MAG TPA: LysM domain-containing protein [Actinomycetota bacterium]|nr:LysM domain-containing protein [Actinomycetota bacterium]
MSRTRVRGRRLAITLGLSLVAAAWAGPAAGALVGGDRVEPVSRATHLVRPGDTLWSIARGIAPGSDPRPVVDALVAANGDIDPGALVPGRVLVIPASP